MPCEKGGNSSKENKVLFDPIAHLCIMPSFSITLQCSSWQLAKVVCGFLFICCHIHASVFLLLMPLRTPRCAFATCVSLGRLIKHMISHDSWRNAVLSNMYTAKIYIIYTLVGLVWSQSRESTKIESMRIFYCTANQFTHKVCVWFNKIILYRLQEAFRKDKFSL